MCLRAFSRHPLRIFTHFYHLRRPFSTTYLAKQPELSPNLPLPILRETLRSIGTGTIHLDLYYRPGIALIQLDHPKTHNALSAHMMALLADAVDTLSTLASDPADKTLSVIITGSPHKSFCAGLDLAGAREHFLTPQAGECFSSLMQDTLSRLFHLPLITIAAVNGAALGGGAELTTACDHRILTPSPDSRIQFVQAKMGVSPGWGGGARLVQLVGRTTALRLLGSSLIVTAENGIHLGMVDHIAQEGQDVVEAAVEFAQTYQGKQGADMKENEHSVRAIKGMKKVVVKASERIDTKETMIFEKEIFAGLWGGEDNLSAIARARKKK